MKQQKATLAKQREEYVKKSATLQRELEILRQQCDEIGKEGGRENNRIIKENQKLQVRVLSPEPWVDAFFRLDCSLFNPFPFADRDTEQNEVDTQRHRHAYRNNRG